MTSDINYRDESAPSTPDESAKAVQIIEDALASSVRPITHATARLIAAAINEGDGSPLDHFAGTGQFDAELAGHEAQRVAIPTRQEPWRRALLQYLRATRRAHPWSRSYSAGRVPKGPSRGPAGPGDNAQI